MTEKTIKTRKDHVCSYCEKPILKGSRATVFKGKGGRYDIEDKQIGIFFWKEYLHPQPCNEREIIF